MPSSSSFPQKIVVSCIIFSVLLNFYQYHHKSQINVSCILDAENFENFTKAQFEKLSQNKKAVTMVPIVQCDNNITNRTLQLRLYAFPIGGLGISSTLNRKAVINALESKYATTFVKSIQPIFPDLLDQFTFKILPSNSTTVKKLNHAACCKFDDPQKYGNVTDDHLYLHGNYFQSYKYFHHLRPMIREWLKPTDLASSLANMLFPQALRNSFVICPHIRRGDFKTDGVHEPSDATFTRAATDFLANFYHKSHKEITVAVLGNDQQFAYILYQDKLGNPSRLTISNPYNFTVPSGSPDYSVLVSPSFTPELDLAFSRSFCDVTLITAPSSTFGWWLSYLAKPSAITYYRDINGTRDKVATEMNEFDFNPTGWTKLGMSENGSINIMGVTP
ncbi:hypothetical protein B9Z55_017899 [Caenorhabditis nigoni]|uniref:L-Fucosyltransferase n=1 Tax=Caenorhabditis nigoni TaxID=1611254 RepID=A0A2G5TBU2_9PELO|nr:hypothetical protein B9Z55_017899 [Caenorhabditis nigoni]